MGTTHEVKAEVEIDKMRTEITKLKAETRKILKETAVIPFLAGVAFTVAATGLAAFVLTLAVKLSR